MTSSSDELPRLQHVRARKQQLKSQHLNNLNQSFILRHNCRQESIALLRVISDETWLIAGQSAKIYFFVLID